MVSDFAHCGHAPCDIMAEYTRTFYENGHNFKEGILGNGRFNLLQTLGNGVIYLIFCHSFVLSDWYVLNVGYSMLYFSLCTCKHNLCQHPGVYVVRITHSRGRDGWKMSTTTTRVFVKTKVDIKRAETELFQPA